jgi:hypothetical protein
VDLERGPLSLVSTTIYIVLFIKIGSGIQKFIRRIHEAKDRNMVS